ncbi:MAG: DUF4097 family beta strand repeat-containing protein [Eubacteriales bacterium]|nr:DUF4097 family beta strand repeat-containing protein [Eubacteriales bacterium]
MKNKHNVNPLLHALLPVIIVIAYILIGFLFDSGWAIGWILFLLIPIVETLVNAINTKNPSHFAYPVLVTAIFLFTGMMWGWWHPMWVVFVTIPAYYAICDAVKKSKPQQQAEYQQVPSEANQTNQQGVYYQPPVEASQEQPKNNATAIIITAIICAAVVAVIVIICTFAWLSGGSINVHGIFDDDTQSTESYVEGPYNISTDGIGIIDIEWVNGNVDVQYYDGDTIYIEESSKSDKHPMTYKVDNKTLYIDEYAGNISTALSGRLKKDLTVKIPNGFKTDVINIDVVSAEVTASSIDTLGFELNSVSGNSHISFVSQPQEIETDTVSGNIQLVLPEDISGYSISNESVSGSINTNDFGNTLYYGDGYTRIEHDAVSGNLTLEKAK